MAKGLIDRDDSVLCVVDIQDGFLNKLPARQAESIVDGSRFLVEVAVRLEIPIFVTVEDAKKNGPTSDRVRAVLPSSVSEREKRVFGLCGQDDLRQAVVDQPRRTAVLIGLETDVCILHSAAGLMAEGFRVLIVADATGAPGPAYAYGLARAAALDIEIIHAKGVYYEWIRSLDGLRALEADTPIPPPASTVL